jgi:hypothetical protein
MVYVCIVYAEGGEKLQGVKFGLWRKLTVEVQKMYLSVGLLHTT